jgi:transposase-like protein
MVTVKISLFCPTCGAEDVVRYGRRMGVQRYRCTACGRQFQASRAPKRIHPDVATIVGRMIDDGYVYREISRLCGVSCGYVYARSRSRASSRGN